MLAHVLCLYTHVSAPFDFTQQWAIQVYEGTWKQGGGQPCFPLKTPIGIFAFLFQLFFSTEMLHMPLKMWNSPPYVEVGVLITYEEMEPICHLSITKEKIPMGAL